LGSFYSFVASTKKKRNEEKEITVWEKEKVLSTFLITITYIEIKLCSLASDKSSTAGAEERD